MLNHGKREDAQKVSPRLAKKTWDYVNSRDPVSIQLSSTFESSNRNRPVITRGSVSRISSSLGIGKVSENSYLVLRSGGNDSKSPEINFRIC